MTSTKRAVLDALIAEATVDAYDESQQLAGFCTMIDDCVEIPFEATDQPNSWTHNWSPPM